MEWLLIPSETQGSPAWQHHFQQQDNGLHQARNTI